MARRDQRDRARPRHEMVASIGVPGRSDLIGEKNSFHGPDGERANAFPIGSTLVAQRQLSQKSPLDACLWLANAVLRSMRAAPYPIEDSAVPLLPCRGDARTGRPRGSVDRDHRAIP